jgi:adenylate kinase
MTEEEKLRPYGEMMKENAKKGGQVTKKKLGKKHYQRMQKLGIQTKLAKKKQEKLKVEAYIKKNEQRNLY